MDILFSVNDEGVMTPFKPSKTLSLEAVNNYTYFPKLYCI